jgi:hypothetical protein
MDLAGLPPGRGFNGGAILAIACMAGAILMHLARLLQLGRRHGWRSLLPLVLCVASVPTGVILGHRMLILRFQWNRARYDAVADEIKSGAYRLPLSTADSTLAFRADPIRTNGMVGAVQFMVVTHGFAGHMGYMRVYDEEIEHQISERKILPGGWRWNKPLVAQWYIVGD